MADPPLVHRGLSEALYPRSLFALRAAVCQEQDMGWSPPKRLPARLSVPPLAQKEHG